MSSLKTRHLELEKDHTRVSSEFAELRRRTEEEFKGVAATSADVVTRVLQLDHTAKFSGLAPTCQSLPDVAEFLSKTTASIRSIKNKTVRRLLNDRNGASLEKAARVMASFREANPNAVMPNFVGAKPSGTSLQAVDAFATTLATEMFPRPRP